MFEEGAGIIEQNTTLPHLQVMDHTGSQREEVSLLYLLTWDSFNNSSIFIWPRFFIKNRASSHLSSSQKGAHSLLPFSNSAASRDSKTVFFLPRTVVATPGYHSAKRPEDSHGGESPLSSSIRACFGGGLQSAEFRQPRININRRLMN